MAIPYSRTAVGGLPWYSLLIVSGIALAIWLASREEKRLGLPQDTAVDLALIVVPAGIVGARAYYVAMSWPAFVQDFWSIFRIWEGGIAIYGAVIGGAAGAWLYARRKKLSFASVVDMIAPGLLLAQAIGRWGNYFNMEAYGPLLTDARLQFFPMAVLIPSSGGYAWHAATFFYESMWNLLGFGFLWGTRKRQRHSGNVFLWYLLIYGSGRFIIEQLRQDSLYVGTLRASQWLSLLLCIVAAVLLLMRRFGGERKRLIVSLICAALWLLRWACLFQHGGYMLCMAVTDALAIWLVRQSKPAFLCMLITVLVDGLGLALAMNGVPISIEFSAQLHAAACSITLLTGVGSLTA